MNEYTPEYPSEYWDIALGAERWIDSLRHDTEHGSMWGLAEEKPDTYVANLYTGSAGITIFYLELFDATGETRYLERAEAGGEELLQRIQTYGTLPCAPMGGWLGYMFAFAELGRRSSNPAFSKAAADCVQRQRDQAEPAGAGIGWIQEMPYADLTGHSGTREIYDVAEGAAGAGLGFLYAHEHGVHEHAQSWAEAVGERLLEVAEPAEGGLRWQLMDDIPWPFDAPNFAHGTAGVAYFLTRLFDACGDQRFLHAAIAGAGHVQAMAVPVGDGCLVPHILDDGKPDRFYLGVCHGPPGTARLFYALSQATRDPQWMSWTKQLNAGLFAMGAPEERGRGFWNNISQCCCDAGLGDHAIAMYRITGEDKYLDLARRVAAELKQRALETAKGLSWPQAEHRSQPDFILAQTGYMQGAAGVGSFFVHLAMLQADKPAYIPFVDSPYGQLG